MKSKFEKKDMGEAAYVLGIRIYRDRNSKILYSDKKKYLEKVLKIFSMKNCKSLSISISKGHYLNKSMCPKDDEEVSEMLKVLYAQVVGSLMYAMTNTRPYICHAVGLVSIYQSNPSKEHWQTMKHILRYLQGTKNLKLWFRISDLELIGYSDADFESHVHDKKSTNEYIFLFGGITVFWLSKKHHYVAKSTMEEKFIACSTEVSNADWMKCFIESLNLGLSI